MVKTPSQVTRMIHRYVAGLERHIRIEKVILFGSYADGRAHELSDIDLAVISPDFDGKGLYKRAVLLSKARAYCDPAIESLAYGAKQYARADRQSFLGELKRIGKVAYESRSVAPSKELRQAKPTVAKAHL